MTHWLGILLDAMCIVVGLIIVAEADNKIRRTDPSWAALRALAPLARVAMVVRAVGWLCLFLVGLGVMGAPYLAREYLLVGFILAALGSACLIVRARLEEFTRKPTPESDPYQRTQLLRRPDA